MLTPGNVLYGTFRLSNIIAKPKYAIVLCKDDNFCILATYTTSKARSGASTYVHGKNPPGSTTPKSHVFLSSKIVGTYMDQGVSKSFQFPLDSTVVPDYGFTYSSSADFLDNATDLELKCSLYEEEYLSLIYTLYQCKKTPREYKKVFEGILSQKSK